MLQQRNIDRCIECMKEHEQLAEWLEELKELREYKKKMKAQFLDDIENPLEPIKLSSALVNYINGWQHDKFVLGHSNIAKGEEHE